MNLPFLKAKKTPRVAKPGEDTTLVNGSPEDHLELHCISELMDAIANKDVRLIRDAIHSLTMNCFDWSEDGKDVEY